MESGGEYAVKIGIITYHRALNYGAVLQAYALQKALMDIGIDSDVIDYRSEYIEYFYKPIKANPLKRPKMFLRELFFASSNSKKRKNFDTFINRYLNTSRTVCTQAELKALNDKYDLFITGSDQVWNLKWSGFDKAYFLDFAESSKKYSYAASFGFDAIPSGEEATYKKLLSDFEAISVRENTGRKIVDELLQKDARIDVDPTCLLTKADWESVCVKPSESGYVLVYTLEKSDELMAFAQNLAREQNKKVVLIADALRKTYDFEYKGFLSPSEFVGLFANADYVVTNSFHGLMFSVIFEKEFCIQYQKRANAPNSRLIDFIRDYGLESRVFSNSKDPCEKIDYEDVKTRMKSKADESIQYLLSMTEKKESNRVILPVAKEKCCGCRACEQSCPKKAIHMRSDEEGFLYPVINYNACISCKRCLNVCAFKERECPDTLSKMPKAVVAYLKDENERMKSRSGGVFAAVSDYVLDHGGVVYGVAFTTDLSVCHIRTEDKNARDALRGSKYVQSDTRNTFSEVLDDLSGGKIVLYSGTACQIDGLLHFLSAQKAKYERTHLITIDIVCHGVMSPKIWKDNLDEIANRNCGQVERANFRDKSFGWDTHIESYTMGEKTVCSERYTSIFYEHCGLRPACYRCPYATTERLADITLADAWGAKRAVSEWDSSKGISLIMLNSAKGAELFGKAAESLTFKEVELNRMMQPNMRAPTKMPENRSRFWNEYSQYGFSYIADKCVKNQMRIRRSNRLKGRIVKCMKAIHLK